MPKTDMHFGAKKHLFDKARELRLNMTQAEIRLWSVINRKQLDLKFRNQHPISEFIADFYCHSIKLVIEVDGGIHSEDDQAKSDIMRTSILNEHGIHVIRFTNEEIFEDIERVKSMILVYAPPPLKGS